MTECNYQGEMLRERVDYTAVTLSHIRFGSGRRKELPHSNFGQTCSFSAVFCPAKATVYIVPVKVRKSIPLVHSFTPNLVMTGEGVDTAVPTFKKPRKETDGHGRQRARLVAAYLQSQSQASSRRPRRDKTQWILLISTFHELRNHVTANLGEKFRNLAPNGCRLGPTLT